MTRPLQKIFIFAALIAIGFLESKSDGMLIGTANSKVSQISPTKLEPHSKDKGASVASDASYFEGNVTDVTPALQFKLDCCKQELKLGMVALKDGSGVNLARINAVLRSQQLRCTSFDQRSDDIPDSVVLVWCNTLNGGFVSQILIDQNLVEEKCDVSGNQFGTC